MIEIPVRNHCELCNGSGCVSCERGYVVVWMPFRLAQFIARAEEYREGDQVEGKAA